MKSSQKHALALALFLAGWLLLLPLMRATMEVSAYSKAKSAEIMKRFSDADRKIIQFKSAKSRLPSQAELDELVGYKPGKIFHILIQTHGTLNCGDDPNYMPPLAGPYILETWRGEWSECFAPHTGASTIKL